MVIAALLAGGSGARMGGAVPKQFLNIGGTPVLVHSLRAFVQSGLVDACVISVPAAFLETTRDLVQKEGTESCPVHVIEGGATRSGTLLKILEYLDENGLLQDSILLTHDAVRPFISGRIIADNIAAARELGACNTCVPATDTIFLSADGRVIDSVPERSTVYHAQTPQSFAGDALYALCREIPPAEFDRMTDGCSVYAYFGRPVALVEGDRDNIKITWPEDLTRAEEILQRRNSATDQES